MGCPPSSFLVCPAPPLFSSFSLPFPSLKVNWLASCSAFGHVATGAVFVGRPFFLPSGMWLQALFSLGGPFSCLPACGYGRCFRWEALFSCLRRSSLCPLCFLSSLFVPGLPCSPSLLLFLPSFPLPQGELDGFVFGLRACGYGRCFRWEALFLAFGHVATGAVFVGRPFFLPSGMWLRAQFSL